MLDWKVWLVPVIFSIFLIVSSFQHFLLFHTLAEFSTIVIGVLMFVVALYTYPFSRESFLMYLATGYFWVAGMDMVHTLVYKGMGISLLDGANASTQFWIANRYIESLLLFSAPFFLNHWRLKPAWSFITYGLVASLLYFLIVGGYFPNTYIEGEGLTGFKIASEYIICFILFMALAHLYLQRRKLKSGLFPFLAASIVMTIFAELSFTSYINVYGPANLIGHIFKLFSFWLIFYSIIRVSMQEPYYSLSRTTSLLTTLRDGIPDLIFYKDNDGVYIGCNQAFCELVGKSSEKDIIGVTNFDLFDREQAESSRKTDEEVLKKGVALQNDSWVTYPDGRKVLFDTLKTPYKNMNGEVIGLIGISRNITERNKAEAAMQALVASTSEHIGEDFFKSAVEKLYHWMGADVVILGELVESRQIKAHAMMVDGEFVKEFDYNLNGTPCGNVINEGFHSYPENIINLFPEDDDLVQLKAESYIGTPIKDKAGKVVGILCALSRKRDHFPSNIEGVFKVVAARAGVEVEREMIEEQFRQAQKMEALGTLVGGIAHDFNNTLAGITGNLYLAKKEIKDIPETFARLESIERLSYHAADMIQQLLTFSRKGIVKMKSMAVPVFLKEIVKMYKIILPENIMLYQIVEDSDMVIKGDASQLQQAIMNLLNNARDAVADTGNPKITLKLKQFTADVQFKGNYPDITGEEFACISVIDNGDGIEAADLEHIFEPFFTTKGVGKGTGLGLSMVYGAIQSHGGLITVKSKVGRGSKFHLYLPLLESDESPVISRPEEKTVQGSGNTILLVDDDETVRKIGHDILESLGYKVLLASDGLNAVEIYKAHSTTINLTVLDIVMPRMGGIEAAEEIREFDKSAKVIFVTGYDPSQQLTADAMASEKVLSKPYQIYEFSQAIKEALESK